MDLEERVAYLEKQVVLLNNRLFELGSRQEITGEEEYIRKHSEFCDKSYAAKLLGVTRATVYSMIANGRISTGYEGKRVSVRSIYRYINRENKDA